MGTKGFVKFEITINFLVSYFWLILIPMLWAYGHYKYFNSFIVVTVFKCQNLERQILTYKDGPRAERVKCVTAVPFNLGGLFTRLKYLYVDYALLTSCFFRLDLHNQNSDWRNTVI